MIMDRLEVVVDVVGIDQHQDSNHDLKNQILL